MPQCTACDSQKCINIDNFLTCTQCGLMFEHRPTYVTSYNCPQVPRRRQYYSRCKRFKKYVQVFGFEPLFSNMENILYAYSTIEFLWSTMKRDDGRKYFFSRKVVLFFIVENLQLGVEVPVLKDEERTEKQLKSLHSILVRGAAQGFL
jgi:hypothetical protein